MHYQRWKFHEDPEWNPKASVEGPCSVEGCERPKLQKGFCASHYHRWRRHGDPLAGNASRKYTKEERKEYKRLWYEKNREKLLIKARERSITHRTDHNGYKKKWKKNHPAQVRAATIARKRNLKESTPPWVTEAQWDQMNEIYAAARRMTEITGEPYHVDHIVPLAARENVRGLHVPWNLRVMKGEENMKRTRKQH